MDDIPRNTANDGLTLEERIAEMVRVNGELVREVAALEAELKVHIERLARAMGCNSRLVIDVETEKVFDRIAKEVATPPDVGRLQ